MTVSALRAPMCWSRSCLHREKFIWSSLGLAGGKQEGEARDVVGGGWHTEITDTFTQLNTIFTKCNSKLMLYWEDTWWSFLLIMVLRSTRTKSSYRCATVYQNTPCLVTSAGATDELHHSHSVQHFDYSASSFALLKQMYWCCCLVGPTVSVNANTIVEQKGPTLCSNWSENTYANVLIWTAGESTGEGQWWE